MTDLKHLETLYVRQKITMKRNRYEIVEAAPGGGPGELLALSEQDQRAFAAGATFCSDDQQTQPVFGFTARNPEVIEAGFDVTDESGSPLGSFHREYSSSFLRPVYHVESAGVTGAGMERSNSVALARRFTEVPFLPVHYEFVTPDDEPLFGIERRRRVRDLYLVTVPDPRVDFRFAAAVAVALDAHLNR